MEKVNIKVSGPFFKSITPQLLETVLKASMLDEAALAKLEGNATD
jgi:hypothetical protein